VRDLVASKSFRERGLWNVPVVERLIDEHDAIMRAGQPAENHMMFLWQLLSMECWLAWCNG
jgi:asparagine synthase (glutamine-hydrolysing)